MVNFKKVKFNGVLRSHLESPPFLFLLFVLFYFETGSHNVTRAGLGLAVILLLCFLSTEITGVCHHTRFRRFLPKIIKLFI
jgi:hypothetical protein